MRIDIDLGSPTPPYSQLIDQIEASVARGEVSAGHRLPTVRQLARDLGLAANTVARAYRELEAAGLIETQGRRGTFVGAHADARDTGEDRLARAAQRFVNEVAPLDVDDRSVMAAVLHALATK